MSDSNPNYTRPIHGSIIGMGFDETGPVLETWDANLKRALRWRLAPDQPDPTPPFDPANYQGEWSL